MVGRAGRHVVCNIFLLLVVESWRITRRLSWQVAEPMKYRLEPPPQECALG